MTIRFWPSALSAAFLALSFLRPPAAFAQSGVAVRLDEMGYVEALDDVRLRPTAALTLAIWYKYEGYGNRNGGRLAGKSALASEPAYQFYGIYLEGEVQGQQQAGIFAGSIENTPVAYFHSDAYVPYRWMHFAFVFDGVSRQSALYLDGVLSKREPVTFDSIVTGTGPFRVGRDAQYNAGSRGLFDDLAFWDRALSPEEIQTLSTASLTTLPVNPVLVWNFETIERQGDDFYVLNAVTDPQTLKGKLVGATIIDAATGLDPSTTAGAGGGSRQGGATDSTEEPSPTVVPITAGGAGAAATTATGGQKTALPSDDQTGCGCRVTPARSNGWWLAALGALSTLRWAHRRRRAIEFGRSRRFGRSGPPCLSLKGEFGVTGKPPESAELDRPN